MGADTTIPSTLQKTITQTPKNAEDVQRLVEEHGITQIKVGVYDVDGILRGKYMSKEKFLSSIEGGFGFCDVVLGWDMEDRMYDNTTLTGWHKAFPDTPVRVLLDSVRLMPTEPHTLFFQAEFADKLEVLCPRGILRKVLARAADMGYSAVAGFEYEFLVIEETPEALFQKQYQNMVPMGRGATGYSVLRNSVNTDFYLGLQAMCRAMDMPVEGFHEETGPGMLELALTVNPALRAADNAALFKTFSKVLGQRQGRTVSFMAKWDETLSGQGGHTHISLSRNGDPVFFDASQPRNIGQTERHFIGGLQKCLPEIAAFAAPTVNSYRRLVPGFWAPTNATWGIDNRTVGIRAISGSKKSQRIEYRVPGADTNPYLVLASALAAGLYGVEHGIEPTAPIEGNGYVSEVKPEQRLPRSLWDAAQRLRASVFAREWLGDAFVDHYAATREWEEREFQRSVTDWEKKRYFELV